MENLSVEMRTEGATAFRNVISKAIAGATSSTGSLTLSKYMSKELYNAFTAAFGSVLLGFTGASFISGAPDGSVAGTTITSAGPTYTDNPVVETNPNVGSAESVLVTSKTSVTGFAVQVVVDPSAAASNLWNTHTAATNNVRTVLVRQIPKSNLVKYLPEGATGAEVPLVTDALPLVWGNKLNFVFDVDTNTTPNENIPVEDNVTQANGDSAPGPTNVPGKNMFNLNLANRRVAFEFVLGTADGVSVAGSKYLTGGASMSANPAQVIIADGVTLTYGVVYGTTGATGATFI